MKFIFLVFFFHLSLVANEHAIANDEDLVVAILLNHQRINPAIIQSIYSGVFEALAQHKITIKHFDVSKLSTHEEWRIFLSGLSYQGVDYYIGPLIKEHVSMLAATLPEVQIRGVVMNEPIGNLPEASKEYFRMASLSQFDDLKQVLGLLENTPGSHIILLPASYEYRDITNLLDAAPESVLPWYYDDTASDLGEVIEFLLASDLSKQRIVNLKTRGLHRFEAQPRRRQDLGSISLFGTTKLIRSAINYLRYYYSNQLPIFAPYAIIENWTPESLRASNGAISFASKWIMGYNQDDTYSKKKVMPFFYAYGYDIGRMLYATIHGTQPTATKLGTWQYSADRVRFHRIGQPTLLGKKKLFSLSEKAIADQFKRNQTSFEYRRHRLTQINE